jgi:2-haloacid dehalogenase
LFLLNPYMLSGRPASSLNLQMNETEVAPVDPGNIMLDFNRFEWLSFDCYGTLVDWETGISTAVAEVLNSHGISKSRSEILQLFADAEPRVQSSPEYLDYRRVLRGVMELIGSELDLQFNADELGCLADTLPSWPVFPDVADALDALKARYKLAIISNVDDDLFAQTAEAMGFAFDAVVTSQQARRYKPDLSNFQLAAERMAVERENWLHIGESLYHDIGPANRLGIASVWVNRADRGGGTRQTDAVPDLVVPDLASLARMMRPE